MANSIKTVFLLGALTGLLMFIGGPDRRTGRYLYRLHFRRDHEFRQLLVFPTR